MKYNEANSLLKILALSSKNLKEGNSKPLDKTFKDLRKRIIKFKQEQNKKKN